MKENALLAVTCALTLLLGFGQSCKAQTKQEKSTSEQDKNKPHIVALHPNDSESFEYDAGKVRFLASSEETGGRWAVLEMTERPGNKSRVQRHNFTDEQVYVMEGVLTVMVNGKTSEYPAGSYLLIPRGTPHAHGTFGKTPSKHLLTVMPGGFERFLRDRIELVKTAKPGDPEFTKKLAEIRRDVDSEVLGEWEVQK
jgi:quercetin dioxygenase-like cupin family protein